SVERDVFRRSCADRGPRKLVDVLGCPGHGYLQRGLLVALYQRLLWSEGRRPAPDSSRTSAMDALSCGAARVALSGGRHSPRLERGPDSGECGYCPARGSGTDLQSGCVAWFQLAVNDEYCCFGVRCNAVFHLAPVLRSEKPYPSPGSASHQGHQDLRQYPAKCHRGG